MKRTTLESELAALAEVGTVQLAKRDGWIVTVFHGSRTEVGLQMHRHYESDSLRAAVGKAYDAEMRQK